MCNVVRRMYRNPNAKQKLIKCLWEESKLLSCRRDSHSPGGANAADDPTDVRRGREGRKGRHNIELSFRSVLP